MKKKLITNSFMLVVLGLAGLALCGSKEILAETATLTQHYVDYDTEEEVHHPNTYQCNVGETIECGGRREWESDDLADLNNFYFPPLQPTVIQPEGNTITFKYIMKEPGRLDQDFWRYDGDWSKILANVQQQILADPENADLNANYYRFVQDRFHDFNDDIPFNAWQDTKFLTIGHAYLPEPDQYRIPIFRNNFGGFIGPIDYPNEVLVHSYNGFAVANNLYLAIPLKDGLRTRVADSLGVAPEKLATGLIIVIQSPANIGQGWIPDQNLPDQGYREEDKQVSLKPQLAYARKYHNSEEESVFNCSAAVFAPQVATNKPLNDVCAGTLLHPNEQNGQMVISPDCLELGFTNRQILAGENRAVLSNVEFIDGNLAGQKKTTLNFVFSRACYNEIMAAVDRKQNFGEILKRQVQQHHISDEIATLLDLPR